MNAISTSAPYWTDSAPIAPVKQVQSNLATQRPTLSTPQADTVTLSAPAQAHAMQQQGMAVKTIAANMGITTQTVDSYLGITAAGSGGAGSGEALAEVKKVAAHVHVIPASSGLPAATHKAA